jgi:hypothetical protein
MRANDFASASIVRELRGQLLEFVNRAAEQREKLKRQLDMADQFIRLLRNR